MGSSCSNTVHVNLQKKEVYDFLLQPATSFFACRIVVQGLLRRNIKARHKIPEFLNTHIWHTMIGVEKWKLGTWNWGQIFNIKLWMVGQYYSSSRSSYERLVSNTLDYCLQRQIAQKNCQIEIWSLSSTWLSNITLHLLSIWLQTLVVINSQLYSCFQAFGLPHLK